MVTYRIGTEPGDYAYTLDDGTNVLARVRRLRTRPGILSLVVRVCELGKDDKPITVNGEIAWTREHGWSGTVAGMLTEGRDVKVQIAEAVEGIARQLVAELEDARRTMEVLTDIPMDDFAETTATRSET